MTIKTDMGSRRRAARGVFHALAREKSGLALIEFAFSLPILLIMGLLGTETANLATVTLRINQIATQVADNGSRIGEAQLLSARRIYEADLNDVLLGADLHAGANMDLYEHGRIVMSSLQEDDGEQIIFWQRCMGEKDVSSQYGEEGDEVDSMGPEGAEVTAPEDEAVIYVEVAYDYQPLLVDDITAGLFTKGRTIRSRAVFNVRDDRDLSHIYDRTGSDPVATCDQFVSDISELDT